MVSNSAMNLCTRSRAYQVSHLRFNSMPFRTKTVQNVELKVHLFVHIIIIIKKNEQVTYVLHVSNSKCTLSLFADFSVFNKVVTVHYCFDMQSLALWTSHKHTRRFVTLDWNFWLLNKWAYQLIAVVVELCCHVRVRCSFFELDRNARTV